MIVALQTQKPPQKKTPCPPILSHPRKTFPPVHYQAALLPTAWGLSGIVWKSAPDTGPAESSAFIERPRDALLCRILTPGLPVDALRAALLASHPRCTEVIADRSGNFHPEIVPTWFPELAHRLQGYYSNTLHPSLRPDFSNSWHLWQWRLDWAPLTPFQRQVLQITASIPRGQRQTYGDLARTLGKPRATRAVGAALARNPWPVLIPCHRVVGANGSMTGFSAPGGVGVKQRMLALEART